MLRPGVPPVLNQEGRVYSPQEEQFPAISGFCVILIFYTTALVDSHMHTYIPDGP